MSPDPARAARARRLAEGAVALGIALTPDQRDRLLAYLELLTRWNRTHNLTAVRDPDAMVTLHLLDSLACLPHVRGPRLLDVGSGAGLPGLVLAIAEPALEVTLLDAAAKRVRFLTQARIELGLGNVSVVHARAETFAPGAGFDTVVMRAVTRLAEGLALARPLLAPGGRLLMPKGRYPEAELAALEGSGLRVEVLPLAVPGLDAERHLVVLRDCRTIPSPPTS